MEASETKPAGNLRETCGKPAVVAILLAEAKRKGVSVVVEGDLLRVRGPRAVESLMRELVARKAAVIAMLAAQELLPTSGSSVTATGGDGSGAFAPLPSTTAPTAPAPASLAPRAVDEVSDPFAIAAAEACNLAEQVGGRWLEFVKRSIDAGDAGLLKSQIAAMKKIVQAAE